MAGRDNLHAQPVTCQLCGATTRVRLFPLHCPCGAKLGPAGVPISDPTACMHRGERTGETFPCKPCEAEGLSELPIYGCRLYGDALLRRPVGRGVWEGAVCLTCLDRQPE